GLVINLDMGLVEILDPLPSLFGNRRVERFMQPIVNALSYLINKVATSHQNQSNALKPFLWSRIPDLYTNTRSGDCGPVSMKFLEMHAHGDLAPHISNITDEDVYAFRKQYALDIYKTIVLPSYYAPPLP